MGDVADGTADGLAAVAAVAGPPDSTADDAFADCGAPFISTATWGALTVTANEGALFGWQVDRPGPVPAPFALPYDIEVGDPFSEVLAVPGVSAPERDEAFDVVVVDADGVTWWAASDDPDSPVTVIGHSLVTCG